MTTESIAGATVSTQANVYFDGKCVSHSLTWPMARRNRWWYCRPRLTFQHRRG